MKTYTSTTASVMAKPNPTVADIMEDGEKYAQELKVTREKASSAYWNHHETVKSTSFECSSDQIAAIAKLGQLGIALKKLDEAYSALNLIRCL